MRRRESLSALVALGASAFVGRRASAAPLDDALADVAKARASLVTLQGPFVQERTLSLLASKVKSTGKMWMVRKENRLRWELEPPDAAIYWVLPDALAYQTKQGKGRIDKNAPGAGPLGGLLGDLLVLLGGDLSTLKARYDLTLVKRDATGLVLHAVPKDKAIAKNTQRIELSLGKDLAQLERVVLVEKGNDKSEITFGVLTKNQAVDPKLVAGPT